MNWDAAISPSPDLPNQKQCETGSLVEYIQENLPISVNAFVVFRLSFA